MRLDLNSVESIVAWWRVWPERHGNYLHFKLRTSPEFAPHIHAALQAMASRPDLQALWARSAADEHAFGARRHAAHEAWGEAESSAAADAWETAWDDEGAHHANSEDCEDPDIEPPDTEGEPPPTWFASRGKRPPHLSSLRA